MDSEDKKKALSERETMQKLCLNRKKQNFDALKQWDQIRAHKLITHRKVADEIDDALQTRVAESDEFLRVVMQFLSDKETQQKKYESQGLTNPQNKLQSNSISRNIHITTSECLTRLYKSTQSFKSYKKLKIILEEGVKNIQKMLTESERDIMEIRTRIELKAVEIQNENGLTIEKCDEVVAAYQKEGAVKLFTAQSDLFYLQQQFLQQSISQTKTQQSLGQAVVQFLKCVQKYEKQKLELVRETLEKYLSCLLQIGEDNQGVKSMLDILEKRTQDEIIHNFYSSESFLSKQMMKDIIKAQCKDDNFKIDLNTILNFLTRITYHPFDSRNLVLKQYKTYIKNEDELQNSYLMVTVDAFLHVYHYKDQFQLLEAKPLYTLRCTNGLDMKREGDINLHIKAKKWHINLSKQSGENISIVFLSEDQREEFVQFVGKIVI